MRVLAKELLSAIAARCWAFNGLRIYLMYTFLFPGQYANVMGYAIVVSVSLTFSVILAVGGRQLLAAKNWVPTPLPLSYPLHSSPLWTPAA